MSPLTSFQFPGRYTLNYCLRQQLSTINCQNNNEVLEDIVTRTSNMFAHRKPDEMTLEGDVAMIIRMTEKRGNSDITMEQMERSLMFAVEKCSCPDNDKSWLNYIKSTSYKIIP